METLNRISRREALAVSGEHKYRKEYTICFRNHEIIRPMTYCKYCNDLSLLKTTTTTSHKSQKRKAEGRRANTTKHEPGLEDDDDLTLTLFLRRRRSSMQAKEAQSTNNILR